MSLRAELKELEQQNTPENYFRKVATYNPGFFNTSSVVSELNEMLDEDDPKSNHTTLFICARADAQRAYAILTTPHLLAALLTSDQNKPQYILATLAEDHVPVAIHILTTPALKEKLPEGKISLKDIFAQIANAHSNIPLVKTLCSEDQIAKKFNESGSISLFWQCAKKLAQLTDGKQIPDELKSKQDIMEAIQAAKLFIKK